MRFVISGEWTRNRLLKLIVLWFMLFTFLFGITVSLMFYVDMGLGYQGVVEHYLGSEERFIAPKSFKGLLEISHYHAFAYGMLLMTMTHLLLFVQLRESLKAVIISLTFISGLALEGSSWLIRYVSPGFAYLKLTAFYVFLLSLLILIVAVVYALLFNMKSDYKTSAKPNQS